MTGEYFEVYPTSGSCAFDARPHGKLGHDEAMDRARKGSDHGGPGHAVDRITVVDGQRRRNRIAEFHDGQPRRLGDLK